MNETPKSKLKSLGADDNHGKVHPIRSRYAASFAYAEVAQAHEAVGTVEGVGLFDRHPRQCAALGSELVAAAVEVLLGVEQ